MLKNMKSLTFKCISHSYTNLSSNRHRIGANGHPLHREPQRICLLTNELYKSHLNVSLYRSLRGSFPVLPSFTCR